MVKLGLKKDIGTRSRSVTDINKNTLNGLNYDVLNLRELHDEVPLSQQKGEDEELDSARRANQKILEDFDQLLRNSLYKWKKVKKPKFQFNQQKVAEALCDTYINEIMNFDNAALGASLVNIIDTDMNNTSNKLQKQDSAHSAHSANSARSTKSEKNSVRSSARS